MINAGGEADTTRLKTGISENKQHTETRNLGELFKEAKSRSFCQTKKQKRKTFHTGISYLNLVWNKQCKQGFQWRYTYRDGRNKKRSIVRVDLLELKEEVLNRGLEWNVTSYKYAKQTAKKAKIKMNQLIGE